MRICHTDQQKATWFENVYKFSLIWPYIKCQQIFNCLCLLPYILFTPFLLTTWQDVVMRCFFLVVCFLQWKCFMSQSCQGFIGLVPFFSRKSSSSRTRKMSVCHQFYMICSIFSWWFILWIIWWKWGLFVAVLEASFAHREWNPFTSELMLHRQYIS